MLILFFFRNKHSAFWSPQVCVFVLSFLLMIDDNLFAQNVSVRFAGGASLSQPNTNIFLSDQHIQPSYGYFLEGGVSFALREQLHLETNVRYSITQYNVVNTAQSAMQANYQDSFIELPLFLEYRAFRFLHTDLSLLAGPYGSYWLRSRSKALYANLFDSTWNPDNDTEIIGLERHSTTISLEEGYLRFALGLGAGLAVKRPISSRIQLGIRAIVQKDITDRMDSKDYYRRYQHVNLSGTVSYNLGRTK